MTLYIHKYISYHIMYACLGPTTPIMLPCTTPPSFSHNQIYASSSTLFSLSFSSSSASSSSIVVFRAVYSIIISMSINWLRRVGTPNQLTNRTMDTHCEIAWSRTSLKRLGQFPARRGSHRHRWVCISFNHRERAKKVKVASHEKETCIQISGQTYTEWQMAAG